MKSYPSIPKDIIDIDIYAFDKLDGSNIRAEWHPKKGFHKFGTKTRLLDPNEKPFGQAVELIKNKYEELNSIFSRERYPSAISFFEFGGPESFAGNHGEGPHDVVLFDVNPFKKGILPPNEYLKLYGHLDIAKLLYHGKANAPFVQSVENGTLQGMTFEGVVCKGMNKKLLTMFKIKNRAWIEKLKEQCKDNEQLFNQLV